MAVNSLPHSYRAAVALAPYTTLQVGGPAEYFTEVYSEAELRTACEYAHARCLPVTVLGGGSNVVVADAGVPGLVVKMAIQERAVVQESPTHIWLRCGAGEVLDEVVAWTVHAGWWGLENLSGIPGTVGATPIQNVGAYGVEVADVITALTVYEHTTGMVKELDPAQCHFAYRDSVFKTPSARDWIITSVTFCLSKVSVPRVTYADLHTLTEDTHLPTLTAIRDRVLHVRSQKFPDWTKVGTAGSFFRNPIISRARYDILVQRYPDLPHYVVDEDRVKVPLGWILDKLCQMRGYQHGAVGTYHGQALVVVQTGGASATEVSDFAEFITQRVWEKTGIRIKEEVTRLPA